MNLKKCYKCNRKKAAHLFSKNKSRVNGNIWCKSCFNKWRKSHLSSLKLTDFNKWKAQQLKSNWNRRAKQVGVDIKNIPSPKEIREWLDSQYPYICYYTGESLNRDYAVDHKVSIINGGSFSLTNLCISAPHINSAKGGLNEKEFKQLLAVLQTWEDKGAALLKRLRISNTMFL